MLLGDTLVDKTYSDLIQLETFKERLEYLRIAQKVAEETFGFDRYLNQSFYHSKEWKTIRDQAIVRDNGCDLAIPGMEILDRFYIHHINPIKRDSLIDSDYSEALDLDNLITVSLATHNAIHYGSDYDQFLRIQNGSERTLGDTKLW